MHKWFDPKKVDLVELGIRILSREDRTLRSQSKHYQPSCVPPNNYSTELQGVKSELASLEALHRALLIEQETEADLKRAKNIPPPGTNIIDLTDSPPPSPKQMVVPRPQPLARNAHEAKIMRLQAPQTLEGYRNLYIADIEAKWKVCLVSGDCYDPVQSHPEAALRDKKYTWNPYHPSDPATYIPDLSPPLLWESNPNKLYDPDTLFPIEHDRAWMMSAETVEMDEERGQFYDNYKTPEELEAMIEKAERKHGDLAGKGSAFWKGLMYA